MEFLDCRGCSQPLKPPVYQCISGHPHFLCSACYINLPRGKCKTCSGTAFRLCPAMEDAINSILLPCKHGCGQNITYHGKAEHEEVCSEGPCFCPELGCGFRGQTKALLDHFTAHHKWPANHFAYQSPRIDAIPAAPGIRVLHADDGHLFLLKVAPLPLEPSALKVSVVSLQRNTEQPVFGCCFSYKWRIHHSQNVWLDKITNSSLSNGLSEDCSSCILPSVLGAVTPVLQGVFITKQQVDEMEWEEEEDEDDDDDVYDENEDDSDY